MPKLINAIIVKTRFRDKDIDFSMQEKMINPKESTYKKLMSLEEPKICGCSLGSIWPRHTMRILDDDATGKQRRDMQKLPCWTIEGLDTEIFGNAIIYRLEDSEPANVGITIRDLVSRVKTLRK
jgi:hypothetical protein